MEQILSVYVGNYFSMNRRVSSEIVRQKKWTPWGVNIWGDEYALDDVIKFSKPNYLFYD